MSCEIAIKVESLSKVFQIYDTPRDRLKQFGLSWIQQKLGFKPTNYYKEFWALKNVSFEVRKGETVGIIGHNGAGKSTLLQMICGTLNPTSGCVNTNGRVAALLELGSGFNPEFTGRENVYMYATVMGLNKYEIDMRFEEIAEFADIGEFIDQPVKTYSSGMMMRLAFAVAINVSPDILIVDEALAVGDEAFQRKCFSRIDHIKKAGSTILFVTHSTQTVVELCDYGIYLQNGELAYQGQPSRAVALYYGNTNLHSRLSPGSISSDVTKEKIAPDQTLPPTSQVFANFIEDASLGKRQEAEEDSKLSFDASLASGTRHEIYHSQYGVTISNIALKNENSECVNILNSNETYIVELDVEFTKKIQNLSLQVLFKTISGIPIAGNRFPYDQIASKNASIDARKRIKYIFNCTFNPGVYFVSIEASGDQGAQPIIYHKFAEFIAFRVRAKRHNTSIGYISLKPNIEIEALK